MRVAAGGRSAPTRTAASHRLGTRIAKGRAVHVAEFAEQPRDFRRRAAIAARFSIPTRELRGGWRRLTNFGECPKKFVP